MIRVTDYTRMSLGQKRENGEIKTCPHCGKLGLAEEASGKMFYTHLQEWGFSDKGDPVMRWEWCPKTFRA